MCRFEIERATRVACLRRQGAHLLIEVKQSQKFLKELLWRAKLATAAELSSTVFMSEQLHTQHLLRERHLVMIYCCGSTRTNQADIGRRAANLGTYLALIPHSWRRRRGAAMGLNCINRQLFTT